MAARAGRTKLWLGVGAALALFAAANAHLVYVAITSQPDCVPHARPGEVGATGAPRAALPAARSACAPR